MLRTSRAYGKAAFDYALENKALKSWYALCESLQGISHKALSNPTLTADDLWPVFKELDLSEAQTEWLELMMTQHHLKLLPQAAQYFIEHYQKHEGITPVRVITAHDLKATQKTTLTKSLKKQLKTDVVVEFLTNPELIGGVQFEIRDKLIDNSLALTLRQLHSET